MTIKLVIMNLCFVLSVAVWPGVSVTFWDNAWCDEVVMMWWWCRSWIPQQWKLACSGELTRFLRPQGTENMQSKSRVYWKILVRLSWCLCLLEQQQPVDIVFNTPFKARIDQLVTIHMQDNIGDYIKPSTTHFTRYTHPPQTHTNSYYFPFFSHAVVLWNSSPYSVVSLCLNLITYLHNLDTL